MSAIDLAQAPSRTRPSRKSARSSKATSAAAPATTTSSRAVAAGAEAMGGKARWRNATADRRARRSARKTTASSPAPASTPTTSRCRTRPTRASCARRTRTRRSKSIDIDEGEKGARRGRDLHRRRPRRRQVGGLPCGWLITDINGKPMKEPPHPVLAQGKVRHVGDQVALVIAETLDQAKDAAELIDVDYEVLPAVVDAAKARERARRRSTTSAPDNKCYVWALGDKAAVDAAFAKARARHEARLRQQPAHPERDRAARRGRRRTAAPTTATRSTSRARTRTSSGC